MYFKDIDDDDDEHHIDILDHKLEPPATVN